MELIFLGTSSGAPTKTRNVSGIALKERQSKTWHLIDCGEGTQHQLLHTNLTLNNLSSIFVTHVHGDHCYGLPGLLASAGMNGRKAPLTIVAPAGIKEWFEATQQFTQLYLPYELKFVATESLATFELGQLIVDVLPLSHRVPSFAYRFTDIKKTVKLDIAKLQELAIPRGPLWGQLTSGKDIEFQGKSLASSDLVSVNEQRQQITVCGDNDNPELLRDFCSKSDVLVHEATFTQEMAQHAAKVGHSYAKQVATLAESIGLPNLVLSHFSARYQDDPKAKESIDDIRQEATTAFQGNLFIASDLQHYTLNSDSLLELNIPGVDDSWSQ